MEMETASTPAESLLCQFLARRHEDPNADFESFCAANDEHAAQLRSMLARHDQLAEHLAEVAGGGASAQRWRRVLEELQQSRPPAERYHVGDVIGAGGMGTVFEAVDRDFDRSLCLKMMRTPPELVAEIATPSLATQSLSRFVEEARLTGRLDHPGIVPVHDLGVDDLQRVFFTMKRVRGDDLERILQRYEHGDGEWTQARLVMVLQRACEAVAYAHSRGVVHRDLKPANIMVGSFGETYVMDWGLARDLRRESDSPNATDEEVVGTPLYMAPEQASGEAANEAADVYGMGAVLYRLLAGKPPYAEHDEGARQIVERVRKGPPIAIDKAAANAPPELLAICARATARAVQDRYPDMRAMAGDLQAYLEGRVVTAHRTGAWAELRKWVQRNKTAASLAAAAALSVIAGIATVGVVKANAAERLAEENRKVVTANERIREESRTRKATLDFMVNMFDEADPHSLRGPDLKVVEVLDSASQSLDEELAEEPVVLAHLSKHLSRVYGMLGKPASGQKLLKQSLAALERHDLRDAEWLRTRESIALYDVNLGNYPKAIKALREVLSGWQEMPDTTAADERSTRRVLANALLLNGDFNTAIDEFETVEASWLATGEPDRRKLAQVRENLGYALLQLRRYEAAEEHLNEALAGLQPQADENARELIGVRLRLGELYLNQGDTERALEFYLAAEETTAKLYPEDHPDHLAAIGSVGTVLLRQGKLNEATPRLESTYEAYRNKFGDDHRMTWIAACNFAEACRRNGDPARAEQLFQGVFDQIAAGRLQPLAAQAIQAGNGLCDLWAASGRLDKGMALLRERIGLLESADRPEELHASRQQLGTQLFYAGQLEPAIEHFEATWSWYREHGPQQRRRLAGTALTAALLRLRRGERAAEVARFEHGHVSDDPPASAVAHLSFNVVQALLITKEFEDARQFAEQGVEFAAANLPKTSVEWSRAHTARFDVAMLTKDYDTAEKHLAQIESAGVLADLAGRLRQLLAKKRSETNEAEGDGKR